MHTASKLGVIEGTDVLFRFSWSLIFLPQYFLLVFICSKLWWGHCQWIVISQNYFTFFVFVILFFNVVFCVFWFFFVFFSLNPILPILHELLDHHSNRLVRIVKSVKKILYKLHWVTYLCEMWSEEFISSAFNWSVNKFSDELWRGSPSPLNFVNYLFLCLWKN